MAVSPASGAAIARNLTEVHERIAAAARHAARDPQAVRLVVVTKGRSADEIRAVYMAGARAFGENRVEEGLPKIAALRDLVEVGWHMIGHVQSRKARQVAPAFAWMHSVDRLKIARLLDQAVVTAAVRLKVFLECNVSGEESKTGWLLADRSRWEAVLPEFEQIARLPGLDVRGLMTMAPWTPRMEQARPVFATLRELQSFVCTRLGVGWSELSMGMTDDFEVAVEEGATSVRIGRAVFEGVRPPAAAL
ncbi:MAG: YggS family pyridoxal phosphate enzyme [Chloroflexi bacterium RBG_13_68_17]|nr:MAG: YggS family pyridoxal phosphate enzyme [Chloroflexi bacterium RBG_13_68_17]